MNSFGTTTQQYPLIDPRCIREHRERFGRDSFSELNLANSYYSMSGRWPDVGWILLDRNSYNRLDPYSNTLQLVIGDFVNDPITITNLSIVQARCVTFGLTSDPNAVYLIQLTNNQGILWNHWFQYPVNAQYNVRAPAYGVNSSYISSSLTGINNTSAWTWDGMIGDLWNKSNNLLGTYPGLPISPDGAPEGWIFVGTSLWEAISQVLDYLGVVISGEYPNFTIVVLGAADTTYTTLLTKYGSSASPNFCLEDSMEYLDVGSGRVPSQVIVYFHRRNQIYGTEETVRYDSPQWQNTTTYQITVPAPAIFSTAVGTAFLWSDFTIRYDQDSNPILPDVLAAQNIAVQRVQQFFNAIYRGAQGYARSVYSGALPFTTGSLVDGVRWFNTGMLGDMEYKWCGWRTEVMRGCVWDEVTTAYTKNM